LTFVDDQRILYLVSFLSLQPSTEPGASIVGSLLARGAWTLGNALARVVFGSRKTGSACRALTCRLLLALPAALAPSPPRPHPTTGGPLRAEQRCSPFFLPLFFPYPFFSLGWPRLKRQVPGSVLTPPHPSLSTEGPHASPDSPSFRALSARMALSREPSVDRRRTRSRAILVFGKAADGRLEIIGHSGEASRYRSECECKIKAATNYYD
jgi:hypothetical protein